MPRSAARRHARRMIALLALILALPDAAPVALHQSARLGVVRVTPVRVEEDSRCPMNARCVWAGRVVVRAIVTEHNRRTTRRFTLGEPDPPTGIVLDSVTPDRIAGAGQRPLRYRFHFALARPD